MKRLICFVSILVCFSFVYTQQNLFEPQKNAPLRGEKMVSDVKALTRVAHESAEYLQKLPKSKYVTADAGLLAHHGVSLDQVKETLEFIADTGKKKPKLLASPWFFNKHFEFYRWYGDKSKQTEYIPKGWKPAPEHIRTTQYRITEIPGSEKKTRKYFYGLYELPRDEISLTFEQRKEQKNNLLRFAHSRSQILAGALKTNKKTKPLAWVTENGRKEFAMQGSALINFGKGNKKLLRVAGSNGMKKAEQYWYSTEVAKRPTSSVFPVKVKPRAGVTCAGDVKLLGFGKMIALVGLNPQTQREEIRLQVLVDTGSAFKGNLSKLDQFTGYFKDDAAFKAHTKMYSHTARAYILIKKKTS
ncbi:MAG: membrane-bound lytic murein transglycosylase [Alteromonas naphthalenivorans]|jgi:membrane-bound lytic murein transglycosylase